MSFVLHHEITCDEKFCGETCQFLSSLDIKYSGYAIPICSLFRDSLQADPEEGRKPRRCYKCHFAEFPNKVEDFNWSTYEFNQKGESK